MREQENRTGAESGSNGKRGGSGGSAAPTAADGKSLTPSCDAEAEPAKEEEMVGVDRYTFPIAAAVRFFLCVSVSESMSVAKGARLAHRPAFLLLFETFS